MVGVLPDQGVIEEFHQGTHWWCGRWMVAGKMFGHLGGIHSLFPKAGSEICPSISLRFRSFDTCTEARSLIFAFSWT